MITKSKLFLYFLVLFLHSIQFVVASPTKQDAAVTTELERLIKNHKVRAAIVISSDENSDAIGVMKFGEISDARREVPNENTTVFEIGSITKVFTALLVQTLVADELLAWDGTIREFLPDVQFVNESVGNISLRELATHRSGLPRLPSNFTETKIPGNPMDPYASYSTDYLVAFLESFDPAKLNKEYAYSNLGFGLLGYIAAETLDTSYAEAMKDRVFQPLNMNNSSALDSIEDDTELAAGYSFTANMGVWNFNVHAGAGVIRSTAMDMYKFIRANFSEKDDEIHQAIRAIRVLQYESDHALGWTTQTSNQDTTVFWHNGQTGGYASFLAIDLEAKNGWVILTTSTESEAITLIGASYYRDIVSPNPIDLSPYTGVYKLAEDQFMTISNNDENLQIQVTGQQPIVLVHSEDHVFELNAFNLNATFEIGEDGTATKLSWSQPGVSIEADRVDDSFGIAQRKEVFVDAEILKEYTGKYQLPANAIATITQVGDRLFAQVTGQPVFRVFPMSPTRFFYKALDAEIEFQKNDEGVVTGTMFHQGGEFFARRIVDE